MKCEFEEKQYEMPLNIELTTRAPIYVPGQVFENKIGIDAAIFSKNPKFWKLWCEALWWCPPFFRHYRRGTAIKQEWWDHLKEKLDDERFPKFKFNLFIQHKRPEFISSSLGKEYKYWNQPYFRYDLDSDQQNNLYRLEQKVSPNAIVAYGCPAFWRFAELWFFISSSQLVDNSNFVQPHDLNGHRRYTFTSSGKEGQPFSEHVDIEGLFLLEEIDRMFQRATDFKNNTDFIYSLSKRILVVIEESDEELKEGYTSMMEYLRTPEHRLARAITSILVYTYITNISWGIGYSTQ